MQENTIEARYHTIKDFINKINPLAEIVLVTKGVPVAVFAPLIAAGARDFGENYVASLGEKYSQLRAKQPDLRVHMIGRCQSNKVKDIVAICDYVHSLDRIKLIEAFARAEAAAQKKRRYFIQVNVMAEPQKGGCTPTELPQLQHAAKTAGLEVIGLMLVPSLQHDAAVQYRTMQRLAAEQGLAELSMGMSADYRVALEYGATYVRLGQAIFGARPSN